MINERNSVQQPARQDTSLEQAPNKLILSGDIETRQGFIACMGIGWSRTEAICIPFICVEDTEGYWNEDEELAIVLKLRELFLHPKVEWIFQNGLYDYQYFAANWGVIPKLWMDTMVAHHCCFSGLPKGLDFQSSMYCEYHRYWKDEGKEFHESIKSPEEEDKYWVYNCKDCVTTFECAENLHVNIDKMGQREPYEFQRKQFLPVLRMMLRGVLINQKQKNDLAKKLFEAMYEREKWMKDVLGFVLNPRSPKQMQGFFYEELGLPVQKQRKSGRPTCDDEALKVLAKKEPLVRPLIQVIQEYRSIGVFLSTFVKAELSFDGRARSSYNIAGPETFRWSSSKDAFGNGLNLQNIPKGTEK